MLDRPATYRELFELFENICWQAKAFKETDYVTWDEIEQYRQDNTGENISLYEARKRFLLRTEKLFRYFDKKRIDCVAVDPSYASRTLREILKTEWKNVLQLREADLIVGDEQIVISTIHKAKGRQFSGVVIPCCDSHTYPSPRSETVEARDEDARVLYVGLSRAKRHLALCYDKENGESPFIECIKPCFESGFVNVFRRFLGLEESIPSQDKVSASCDWLLEYNELLEAGLQRQCPTEKVRRILENTREGDKDWILRRIALSTIQYASEVEWRNTCYAQALKGFVCAPEQGDYVNEALNGISNLRLSEYIENNLLRTQFLFACYSPMRDGLHLSILRCYRSFLRCQVVTLEDVFEGRTIHQESDEFRQKIRTGIEDALFSENGDVRFEAARMLVDEFGVTDCRNIDGSDNDWNILPRFMSEHRKTFLLWILRNKQATLPNGAWRTHLEQLINDIQDKELNIPLHR